MDSLVEREHRRTISKFGLDLIITPENSVKVIEINGASSGSAGLTELTGRYVDLEMIEYLSHVDLPLYHFLNLKTFTFPDNVIELEYDVLKRRNFFRPRAPRYAERFVLPVSPCSSDHLKGIIWNLGSCSYLFDEQKYLVVNPFAVENTSVDKALSHSLFCGEILAPLRPKTTFVIQDNAQCDISSFRPTSEYLVFKPTDESLGRNIVVIPTEELYTHDGYIKEHPAVTYWRHQQSGYHEPNVIMEELMESKKIENSRTGKLHNACMRYLILVESENGEISIRHYGGYWRLTPHPVEDADLTKRFVANYSTGAIPEAVSPADLEIARKSIDQFIPILYRRMLRLPLNEKPDDLPIEAYCY
ncbi:hypothetical protein HY496_02500 [Candidatus Woesearchaeota archaeon]|nr:hypothetical protein [Candidatus Woesearchaeota archaeon]